MSEERAIYKTSCKKSQLPHGTRLEYADPEYTHPSGDDVRTALEIGGYTGSEAGKELGVAPRTIRKWVGGEREIPYAAWRLLLIQIGEAEGHAS